MEYVKLICVLVGIIGLIFVLLWAIKKLNKGVIVQGGKRLKVLDRAVLGGEKSVVVVSVAGRCMVLGVTANQITKLEDLPMTEEEYLSQAFPENSDNGGFFTAFKSALAKNAGVNKRENESTDGEDKNSDDK